MGVLGYLLMTIGVLISFVCALAWSIEGAVNAKNLYAACALVLCDLVMVAVIWGAHPHNGTVMLCGAWLLGSIPLFWFRLEKSGDRRHSEPAANDVEGRANSVVRQAEDKLKAFMNEETKITRERAAALEDLRRAEQTLDEFPEMAASAVGAGEDDVARAALGSQQRLLAHVTGLRDTLAQFDATLVDLARARQTIEMHVREVRVWRDDVIRRHRAAAAKKAASEAFRDAHPDSLRGAMKGINALVAQREAEAIAALESLS